MKSDGRDMAAILRYFGQFPVDVIAHPKREQRPDDDCQICYRLGATAQEKN